MRQLLLLLCFVLLSNPIVVSAENIVGATPELYFRTVKTKGDDFVFLRASEGIQLDNYWLGYDSSLPVAELVPEYQLPVGFLGHGETLLLTSDSTVPTCDAVLAADMLVALADTKGAVALWKQSRSSDGKSLRFDLVDSFTWSASAKVAADVMFTDATISSPVGHRIIGAEGLTWKTGILTEEETGNCIVREKNGMEVENIVYDRPDDVAYESVQEENGVEPNSVENGVPGENNNLLPPIISELLPNPAGTGNDDTDEFVELYNPNDAPYDLSGMTLRAGITTVYDYVFPNGTILPTKSYEAFSAEQTGLTLSNTRGLVVLHDRSHTEISRTEAYSSAPDGSAWILSGAVWKWTTTTTPAAENILSEPKPTVLSAIKTTLKNATTTTKKVTAKKTAAKKTATSKTKKTKAKTAEKKAAVTTQKFAQTERPVRGIHPLVLALVASAAVGYGVYEYRHDLANRFYKFRTNRAARRTHRK